MDSGKNLKDKHMNKSIDALKPVLTLALEALERYQVKRQDFDRFADEITAIREALASKSEALDEDQAHYKQVIDDVRKVFDAKREKQPAPVAEPHKQQSAERVEPVAVYVGETWCGSVVRLYEDLPLETPLYTSPPIEATPLASQRSVKPWVGLTDAEFQWIYDNGRTPAGMIEMAEAKLKEKNA